MCITVVNKYKTKDKFEYVGRGNPLGNPFPITDTQSRNDVCDEYATWLPKQIADGNQPVCNELNRLYNQWQETGHLELGCFCAPQRCHAESIKAVLIAAKE